MSLATALKGTVADARPLQNPDFRRFWATQLRPGPAIRPTTCTDLPGRAETSDVESAAQVLVAGGERRAGHGGVRRK